MFTTICRNNKGVTLVESIVAMGLITIGIIAILTMQPTSMKAAAKSDYLGRGVMLLNKEFMNQELFIMNPCNTVAASNITKTVYVSGRSTTAQNDGDALFNVQTTVSAVPSSTTSWKVTVIVTWPPTYTNGVKDSIIVTRQEPFRSGCI